MGQTNLGGLPGNTTDITELGSIPANTVKGITCTQGVFKRGKVGKVYLVGSPNDFAQNFGGDLVDSDDSLKIKRALNKGAKLMLSRVCHLSDIDDISTVVGDKAVGTITGNIVAPVAEELATTSFTITAAGVAGNTITLKNGATVIGTYTVISGDTPTLVADGLAASVTGFTGTNAGAVVTIESLAGTGTTNNGLQLTTTIVGGITTSSIPVMAGGVDEVLSVSSSADFTAEEVGGGYNGTVVTISASSSGKPNKVDIVVVLPDAPTPITVKNYDQVLDGAKAATLNGMLGVVAFDFAGLTNNKLPLGTVTLSGGDEDVTLITDNDHIGSSVSGVGLHAFDNVTEAMRIWNISRPTPDVNQAFADYCEMRKDMTARMYTPLGLNADGLNDYRQGTGIYSHSPMDSLFASLFYTDVLINDPSNPNNNEFLISAIGDMLAARTICDNKAGEWISDSGNDFGKLKGVNAVAINFGSPGKKLQADLLYESGLNFVINHPSIKICNWGNRTTLLDKTSQLSKTNIADLCIYISREIKKMADLMNFKPNEIDMWNKLYRKGRPFVVDTLVKNRAILGIGTANDGEGLWWHWLGDQWAKDLNDLKFNVKSEVDAGKYRMRFAFKANPANEYIGIDISPADSVTIQNIQLLLQP
ncbi:MAG: hypothetical protein EKK63_05010 [Acinetobacter sp.]|uniref:hypothetical protein n=1 Tax=Acinetobacter sp. TaxID=472 RepID=UPI000FBFEEE8|nr:hypothetical protein [Acinetobacter sp.]RUP41617.1 MAG: hypothetical protein EKK63_05010 [Acinetobacter sp.]